MALSFQGTRVALRERERERERGNEYGVEVSVKGSPLSRTSQLVFACSAPTQPFLGLIIAFEMGILMAREGRDALMGGFWLNLMPYKPLLVVTYTLLNWKTGVWNQSPLT